MGTTLTLLLVQGDRAIAAQVGDSRLYLARAGEAYQVTSDHTILAELTRAGKLESLASSPERNLNALTRAVGVHPEVEVDTLEFEVLPGDVFLLCSDGLHGYFDDLDLVEFFHHSSRSAAAGNLIDMALKRGGHDNISAVTVFIGEGDSERLNQFRLTLETVKSIPLFHYLSFSELLRVIRVCELRAVSAEDVLIDEGSDSADFFIVLEGEALVHRAGVELATLGAGKYFGEMSMVDNRPRSATVTMQTDGRVIRISRPDFYELLRADSVLAVKILWNFIQTLSAMVRNNNDKGTAMSALSAAAAVRDDEAPNDEKE
jgi:CRP-like cAMP-binding protein